jgi:hypothetical protein
MTMEEDLTQVARRICATATVFTRSRVEGHQQGRHGGLGGVLLLLGGHCLHKEQGWEGSSQDAMVVWEVRCCQEDVCQRHGIHTQQGRNSPSEDAMVVWEVSCRKLRLLFLCSNTQS